MFSKIFSLVNKNWVSLILSFLITSILGFLLQLLVGSFLAVETDWMGMLKSIFEGNLVPIIQTFGLYFLISWLWGVYFSVSLIKVLMNIIDGKKTIDDLKDAFCQPIMVYVWAFIMQLIVMAIMGGLLYVLIMVLGFGGPLLFIPIGLYLYIKFFAINFVLVEDKCDGFTALGKAWKISGGHVFSSIVIMLVFGIIVYLPVLFLAFIPFIGTIISTLWLWLYGNLLINVASLQIYRRMKGYDTSNSLE